MTFLKPLQDTKLSPLNLLDMAYIIVLMPLLLTLKAPMLAFAFVVVLILFFKKEPANNLLVLFIFVLGILTVYLSLYGAFSFRGLSRLKLFLELLVYILLMVVSMQRLTQKINIYLLISPFLFLALSLFFYHGMFMLVYVVFEIFFLLWMILAHRMDGDLLESFRSSMVMFMYSLPWVVVLFIFFPRISFEHANYGFKGENIQRMGHDGTMHIDSKALLVPSDRIVMEVGFDDKVPTSDQLYFRGSTLYVDKKKHWEALPHHIKRESKFFYATKGEKVSYKVTLYPTQKKWIYLLDMPSRAVDESTLDPDLVSMVEDPIKEPLHYAASSSLSNTFHDVLNDAVYEASTSFYVQSNPKSYKVAKEIKETFPTIQKRAAAIIQFFKTQNLTYTLKPELLDINNSTDSFLFEKRKGYCVHFASSFVTMSRMADIPSRIVTGYKADLSNALKNYIAVKEKDAHAWAELYIDGQWVRVETTSTASSIEAESLAQLSAGAKNENKILQKINLYLMYTKYQVETWILYYSHIRQLQLLAYAKDNPRFVATFVFSLIILVLFTFIIISYFKRPTYTSEAIAILQPLLKRMKKEGYTRNKEETLHYYFTRYLQENPQMDIIKEIDKLYEQLSYGGDTTKASKDKLKKLVKKLS
ncbi:DUF3488 and transglutaminase-like domain-containing protein [Sulfurovum sp.]|uniref:transglutaminase family protein n=1 Tax=Sulfurovum sp. TaxID=1969726 RepID=UPI002867F13C|nr:DUF3488 and transglutaminase-like domain-containing protein [Sulfurovum sp.]